MSQINKKQAITLVVTLIVIFGTLGYLATTLEKPEMKIGTSDFFLKEGETEGGEGASDAMGGEENFGEEDLTQRVVITANGFSPKSLSVTAGDKVHFLNETDDIIQLYTKSDRIEIVREVQQPGAVRTLEFNKTGVAKVINVFDRAHVLDLVVNRK